MILNHVFQRNFKLFTDTILSKKQNHWTGF
jgi:hypothetical protein